MSPLEAVIFDFDGTLVDTEYFHFQCTQMLLQKEFGAQMTHDYYNEKLVGKPTSMSIDDVILDFELSIDPHELLMLIEHFTGNRLMDHDVKMMPYAQESIDFFREKNLPVSIVTGSQYRSVKFILEKKGILNLFEEIVTFDDVVNSKPDPEPYDLCVRRLGIPKDNILVFEDTVNGTKSAKAAGLTCFGIQQDVAMRSKLHEADRTFGSLEDALKEVELAYA